MKTLVHLLILFAGLVLYSCAVNTAMMNSKLAPGGSRPPLNSALGVRSREASPPSVSRESEAKKVEAAINSRSKAYQAEKMSDIDINIPINSKVNSEKYALIIGNEDYSSHQIDLNSKANVEFARNDATIFKEYAKNTVGIPEQNITFLLDATTGQINQAISKLNLII